jgi:hypothetical protein
MLASRTIMAKHEILLRFFVIAPFICFFINTSNLDYSEASATVLTRNSTVHFERALSGLEQYHDHRCQITSTSASISRLGVLRIFACLREPPLFESLVSRKDAKIRKDANIRKDASKRQPTGSAPCGVGGSLQREFLITFGCVSSGQQTRRFLDFDGLHQYAFLPIG